MAWTDGYGSAVTRTRLKGREPHEFTVDQDMLAYRIPLYPLAMPAPQPVAAENTSAGSVAETEKREHESLCSGCGGAVHPNFPCAEAAALRAPALRLPEPMTGEEIYASDELMRLNGRKLGLSLNELAEVVSTIGAVILRRVKEANAEARRVEMLRKLGARLAGLLDEDQFAECEALLLAAGVMPEEKDNVAKA